ncbi:MAG: PHP domain-containing protein [Lachnospiraceae bacterium]|nr:PHP domain-containing protein [Lachnospiraceae bacterium]
MYKIELHLHTDIVSPCGTLHPEEEIEGYKKAGYAGIVVTDHYNRYTAKCIGVDPAAPGSKLPAFLAGYRAMKELGDREGIRVYYGLEVRFDGSDNDYLLYDFSEELVADPEKVFRMSPMAFSELARQDGALFIQAHPFRDHCIPIAPEYVDGIESVNKHVVHNNRNAMAVAYAERHGLLQTGGSDCHDRADIGLGGIDADYLPEDEADLARLIRGRHFTILGREEL